MEWNLIFFVNSVLLGVGLAMDAFSVSIANALSESQMKKSRMCFIAGVYAFFQFAMPMIGWICVHTIVEYFSKFEVLIPWIALALLLWIGGKMIWEAVHGGEECDEVGELEISAARLTFATLMIQGVATSIDALSVGFTIADYGLLMALVASLIIAGVTFAICMTGLLIGKKAGDKLGAKATLAGGLILVGIGIEIFVKGIFF
ncbi:Putative Mn2+ efflux pump MntP [Treponema bryantii]|uniref:Putative manganese efflux pump MntP n=1 Tax=Treponema bryantii TaxID=163 RepID=A0A1I3MYW1_9SPIR|nr:manganese efflux pump MntP family protein [Treponema bryantii]SFJ02304.1 Putative Mn2+ efflux pump MntP [Treponema bryantii]